jgi:protocatechuate 3,4-dioxygenase beta subunit
MKARSLTLGFLLLLGWELLVLTFGFSLLFGGEALAVVPPAAWDVDQAPAKIPADARIAPSGEPGASLVISGTVYAPDGITPLAGAAGHYSFRTIRPAPYPKQSIPAHVHFHLWGPGVPRQFIDDLRFGDDPLVTQKMHVDSSPLGRFATVCSPQRDPEGAQRCTFNIRVRTQSNFP